MAKDMREKGDAAEVGLVCRGCGCRHFEVYYTRPMPNKTIRRVRFCRECGRQKVTYEADASPGLGQLATPCD